MLVQKCPIAICPELRREQAKHGIFERDAEAAAGAYDQPPISPKGYHVATDHELQHLNLTRENIEFPIDPTTGERSQFRAVIFISDSRGVPPIVAFRGTDAREDWTKANIPQGLGKETFHYSQAQFVARRIAGSEMGRDVAFTGHSLGGGLASAAARSTGRSATTFNAAGLHENTVKNPQSTPIDAVHVRGEMLTSIQHLPGAPAAAATERWPLNPPINFGHMLLFAAGLFSGGIGTAAAIAYRAYKLHGMDTVKEALRGRREEIKQEMAANGC